MLTLLHELNELLRALSKLNAWISDELPHKNDEQANHIRTAIALAIGLASELRERIKQDLRPSNLWE